MAQEHPPTIPSQLMDYGDSAPADEKATGSPAVRLLLRVLLAAVAGFVLYKLFKH